MKKFLLIIAFFGALFTAHSQDVIMQNGTFTQCSGVFSDSGGVTSNYSDGENFVITFCPDSVDQFVQLEFTAFSTQLVADVMTIYDGDDTSGAVLGTFSGGTTNPGTISASQQVLQVHNNFICFGCNCKY